MDNVIKEIVINMMKESIDDLMKENGFKRRDGSLHYTKKIGTTKQKLDMFYYSYPSYSPNALMHLYPYFLVDFPRIIEKAREMTEKDPKYSFVFDNNKIVTINEPIQLRVESKRWILVDDKEASKLVLQISAFLKQYTIPLLADLESEEDFIKLYESQDKRIAMGDIQHIYIASAYVLKGDYEKALSVLENRFKVLGHKLHETIFSYIEDLL